MSRPSRQLIARYALGTSAVLRRPHRGAPLDSGHHFESQTIQRIQNVFGRTLRVLLPACSRFDRGPCQKSSKLSPSPPGPSGHCRSGSNGTLRLATSRKADIVERPPGQYVELDKTKRPGIGENLCDVIRRPPARRAGVSMEPGTFEDDEDRRTERTVIGAELTGRVNGLRLLIMRGRGCAL